MAGRPRNNKPYIVYPTEILNDASIRSEIWRFVDLGKEIVNTDTTIEWLARHSLIKNSVQCSACKAACHLSTYSNGAEGKVWSCTCGFRKSLRDGSFFTRSRLPLSKIVILMYCFSEDFTYVFTKHESDIQNLNTVMDWFNFLRGDIGVFLERHPSLIGGLEDNGEPILVEVSETQIIHKKGTGCEGHWILGGVEMSSGKCFIKEMPDRNAATIENIILEHVLPGTHIVSNEWEGYKNLGRIADHIYLHSVERDVIDSDVHTHTMENLFFRARKRLKKHCEACKVGTSFLSYLNEFQFRCNIQKNNVFNELLIVLKDQYPVENVEDFKEQGIA